MVAGCKGLAELEELTRQMPSSIRTQLSIPRRVPDTTVREFLCRLNVDQLVELVEIVGYDAWRRKALHPLEGFPFGVLSMDGKYPSVRDTGDHPYLQVKHDEEGRAIHGSLRLITVSLVTAVGRPILGAIPVPKETNEMGTFGTAFTRMNRVYEGLFRLVMYDAGGASADNAETVLAGKKDYFFQIADTRWTMYQTIEMLMKDKAPVVCEEQIISSKRRVVRELSIISITPTAKNVTIWQHVRTAFKVRSRTYENDVLQHEDTRYYISSMDSSELSGSKWLQLIVLRWGVETCHQILDIAFEEDERPWITSNANGALILMLLRRVAYTILALFKFVTMRFEDHEFVPWRKLMGFIMDALKWPNPIGDSFRPRKFAVPPAFV